MTSRLAVLVFGMLCASRAAAEEEVLAEGAIDVIVEGEPTDPSPRDPTPSIYAVGADRLREPGLDLADALDRAPGVSTARTGGSADPAFVSIRAGRSAQTPVYLASIRLNDDITGQVDLSSLPTWLFHRAEIYRGHAPRWVDDLGMGGAILVEPRLPRATEATAAVGGGSFGFREGRAALSLGDRSASALVAVGHRAGEGDFPYLDDGGTRFDSSDDVERRRINADYGEIDAWVIGRLSFAQGRIVTLVHAFDRRAGAPGLLLPGARQSRVGVRRLLGGVSAQWSPARAWGLSVDASYLDTRYGLRDPRRELGSGGDVENRGQRMAQRLRLGLFPVESLSLGLGIGYTRSRLALDSDFGAGERAERHTAQPSLDARWSPHEMVDVVVVGALACHTTRGSADEGEICGTLEPTGRLGGRFAPWSFGEIFANVGRYVRVPTLGEKYGVSAAVLGNPDLAVEKGLSVELGLRARGRGAVSVHGELVGFARLSGDLVGYRRASLGAVRPYNVGEARVIGAELVAGARFGRHLSSEIVVTAMDARDVSPGRQLDNDRLPYVPRLSIVPTLEARSGRLEAVALEDASIAASFRHQSARVADPAGLVALPAQNLLELSAALAFPSLTLRARVENLLDDRTFDLVGYPLPGRSFHALLEARW